MARTNSLYTAEGSAPDTLVGNLREEAFHQVQPGSTRGREVSVIAGVCGKPCLHRRMGVGGIVVEDEMNRQSAWRAALDPLQKAQKLLVAMTRHAPSQHLAVQYVEGSEQGRSPVASVI